MANSRTSSDRREEASVDTDPGANGHGCNPVCPARVSDGNKREVMFYISSIGTDATVTLQWKDVNDDNYTDYEDHTAVTRQVITEAARDTAWRAIVKDDAQGSSGASVFGISW